MAHEFVVKVKSPESPEFIESELERLLRKASFESVEIEYVDEFDDESDDVEVP